MLNQSGSNQSDDKRDRARKLAEDGLRQQEAGHDTEADALLDQAMQADPDAVAEMLRDTGADTAPDSRDDRSDQHVTPPDAFRQPDR